MTKIKLFLLLSIVSILAACGGGGGGDSSSSSSTTSSYTGKGSTVYNLDWSTHTNPDGSSHQALTSSVISETAKGATVVPVTYATTANWLTSISTTIAGVPNGQILNLSAGVTGDAYGVLSTPTSTPNIVITVAAGNEGTPTLSSGIRMALYNSAYKSSLILVGALDSKGSIASYSSTAGAAADRFVVIDGTATGTSYSGTSYSAPRIAGYAAIIKEKYPNATGEQIASAILNTAVLQPGWDSATYGRGKADLTAALNYLGSTK